MVSPVNSADAAASQAAELMKEIAEQNDQQLKNLQNTHRKEIARIKENNESDAKSLRDENARSLETLKKEFQEGASEQAAEYRKNLVELKRDTYGNNGRLLVEENQTLRDRMYKNNEDWEDTTKLGKLRQDRYIEAMEKKVVENSQKARSDADQAIEAVRDHAQERIDILKNEEKSAANAAVDKAVKRLNDTNQDLILRSDQEKIRLSEEMQKKTEELKRLLDKQQKYYETQMAESARNQQKKTSQAVRTAIDSGNEQNKQLREDSRQVLEADRLSKEREALTRAQTIADQEGEYRFRLKALDNARQEEVEALKNRAKEADKGSSSRFTNEMSARDRKHAEAMRGQAKELGDEAKQTQEALESNLKQVNEFRATERKLAEENLARASAILAKQNEKNLEAQSLASKEDMSQKANRDGTQISELSKKISDLKSGKNLKEYPTTLEQSIAKQYIQRGDELLKEANATHDRDSARIREKYRDELLGTIQESRVKQQKLTQEGTSNLHRERNQFMSYSQDLQETTNAHKRDQQFGHEQEMERLQRAHGTEMNKLRLQFEEQLSNALSEAQTRLVQERQERDFQVNNMAKKFAAKHAETVRSYQREISNQKEDFEARMDTLRGELNSKMRDMERKLKSDLEMEKKSGEQRANELKEFYKERGRLSDENYTIELEKLKRTNALLTQKKS